MSEPSVTINFTPFCFRLNDMETITAFIAKAVPRSNEYSHFKKLYSLEKLQAIFGETKGKSLFGIFELEFDFLSGGGKKPLTTDLIAMPDRRAKGFTLDQALTVAAKSVSAFFDNEAIK